MHIRRNFGSEKESEAIGNREEIPKFFEEAEV